MHGDLHPANLLVDDGGALAGVIDFGDITAGDPATDLAVAWMLLPPGPGTSCGHGSAPTTTPGRRGRGWALHLSLAYLEHSADDPAFHAVGTRGLTAALAGD